jgi:hypothetical protein
LSVVIIVTVLIVAAVFFCRSCSETRDHHVHDSSKTYPIDEPLEWGSGPATTGEVSEPKPEPEPESGSGSDTELTSEAEVSTGIDAWTETDEEEEEEKTSQQRAQPWACFSDMAVPGVCTRRPWTGASRKNWFAVGQRVLVDCAAFGTGV